MPPYAIPYASQTLYDRGPSRTIGELLRAQQEAQAAAVQQQGQIAAQRWGQLGHTISGTIGDILQARQEAPIRAAQAAEQRIKIQNAQAELADRQASAQAQQQANLQQKALQDYFSTLPEGADPDPRKVVSIVGPQAGAKLLSEWAVFRPKPDVPKTREIEVRNPDGTVTKKIVADTPGQDFTSTPEPPKVTYGSPDAVMIGGQRQLVRAGSDNKLYDMQGHVVTAAVTPDVPPSTARPERFWVVRNGQPIRVTDAEYRPGDLPANTREQGRPVTSGDAGRIADFDTSLNDLKTLRGIVAPRDPKTGALMESGATGTTAKIGASLPNVVTNITGWGTTAKEKQAVIDRVKQVIGKAMEGGVLRKEDEYKYEKILPTIGDPVAVVETKLNGLEKAIGQRRQTTLDALDDANYDVSKYRARGTAPAGGPVKVGGFTVTVEP